MRERPERDHVAWDIETTGLEWSAQITAAGFWFSANHATIILNIGPHSIDRGRTVAVLEEQSGADVCLVPVRDEPSVLGEMQQIIFERFDRDYDRLVAFNADSWQGGFDLPFTRTRCIRHGHPWVFDGVVFSDLWEPVVKRLNTTLPTGQPTESVNSLTGAYRLLCSGNEAVGELVRTAESHHVYGSQPYDPFDDSESTVGQYERGNLQAVCAHNLADIHRTWELGELAREFVAPRDLTQKKL